MQYYVLTLCINTAIRQILAVGTPKDVCENPTESVLSYITWWQSWRRDSAKLHSHFLLLAFGFPQLWRALHVKTFVFCVQKKKLKRKRHRYCLCKIVMFHFSVVRVFFCCNSSRCSSSKISSEMSSSSSSSSSSSTGFAQGMESLGKYAKLCLPYPDWK